MVFAMLKARYGPNRHLGARKRWAEVTLSNTGKVTGADWHDFWVRFCRAAFGVKDTTPEETARLLMSRVPAFISTWVIEEQEKISWKNPTLLVSTIAGLPTQAVMDTFQALVGEAPKEVSEKSAGQYLLTFRNRTAAERALLLDGRKIAGANRTIGVEMVDKTLSAEEIFELVSRKLAVNDKKDMFHSLREFPLPKITMAGEAPRGR